MMNWDKINEQQPYVTRVLTGSFSKDRLAHAYVFAGAKGSLKKETALLFAKRYFCLQPIGAEPCQQCIHCQRIDSGNHPDFHHVQADGQSVKVDQIRQLIKEFSLRGVESRKKLYMIEDADTMTANAANGLLKFLEEPQNDSHALLLTEKYQQMLPTLLSRCQVLSFVAPRSEVLEVQLSASTADVSEAIRKTAIKIAEDQEHAEALCRDEWFAPARRVVIQLIKALHKDKNQAFLLLEDQWYDYFQDRLGLAYGLDFLLIGYRDTLHYILGRTDDVTYIDERLLLENIAEHMTVDSVVADIEAILRARRFLDANVQSRLVMEHLLRQLTSVDIFQRI